MTKGHSVIGEEGRGPAGSLPAPGTPDSNSSRQRLVWAATALFVGFLVLVFFYMSNPCDLEHYHRYARTARTGSLTQLYQTCNVEYPPLAVGLILITEEFTSYLPEPQLLWGFNVYKQHPAEARPFQATYRLEMIVCTLATWAVVLMLLRRHYGHEAWNEWAERLTAFALSLWTLGYLLLDRLDITLAGLIVLGLLLLFSRMHYAWSLAVLAAAVDFKFVPVALVPVWLIATLPGSTLVGLCSAPGLGRFLGQCLVRVAVLAGFLAAFTAPLWLFVGKACLNFVTFHAQRGIEFESNYAAILTLLKHWGYPVRTRYGWGSAVLECSAAPLLTQLSGFLVVLFLLAGTGVLLATLARRASACRLAVAKTDAPLIFGHVLWALLIFVLFNKAFSPQYLLWLVPLVALVPLAGRKRRIFQFGFLGVTFLSMLVYPRLCSLVLGSTLASDPQQATGASVYGTGLLMVRLLLLLFLTAMLAGDLLSRARRHSMRNNFTPAKIRWAA
jgi:hypothetical protein